MNEAKSTLKLNLQALLATIPGIEKDRATRMILQSLDRSILDYSGDKTAIVINAIITILELHRLCMEDVSNVEYHVKTQADFVSRYIAPAFQHAKTERYMVIPLGARWEMLKPGKLLTIGTSTSTPFSVKDTAAYLLANRAHAAIIAHNHPGEGGSQPIKPSNADLRATKKLYAALKLVGINLINHFIIGAGTSYYNIHKAHPDCFK